MAGVGKTSGSEVAKMIIRDPTGHPYVAALVVAVVLIVAVMIVSLVWPDMLPWTHKARVVGR
jgi:uncharacterized transporter YbjL